jgi:hypothetical protein
MMSLLTELDNVFGLWFYNYVAPMAMGAAKTVRGLGRRPGGTGAESRIDFLSSLAGLDFAFWKMPRHKCLGYFR